MSWRDIVGAFLITLAVMGGLVVVALSIVWGIYYLVTA